MWLPFSQSAILSRFNGVLAGRYRLRILHIIGSLDPQAGGPSNAIRGIVAAYAGIGSEGEVVTLDGPRSPFLQDLNFTVHALGPVSTRFGYCSRLVPWLRGNRDRFDGVVVHGLWQYIGWAVHRALHPHKPYLVFTHGMLDPYFKRAYPFKHLKKVVYWLLFEFWVLKDANRVLFTSADEAARATQSFWLSSWNPCVVPYGASAPKINPIAAREAFLDAFPALRRSDGSAKPYILFLGRIHAKKGCDLLLEAFSRIAGRVPDLQLVFSGPDGLTTGSLAKKSSGGRNSGSYGLATKLAGKAAAYEISERVHWMGMLQGDRKWGAFFGCEAFALPSHQENFGIAVAEALACGKPVLISDKVNIWRQIVVDGAAFVGSDTLEGTLQTLEDWIALTSAQKIAMGALALDCFRRNFDMKANANGIVNIFSEVVAAPGRLPTILPKAKANAL